MACLLVAHALQTEEMLERSPEAVAVFLAKTEGLDKTLIGDYLGEREDFNLKVMHAYVDSLDFTELEFDSAIRKFLQVGVQHKSCLLPTGVSAPQVACCH